MKQKKHFSLSGLSQKKRLYLLSFCIPFLTMLVIFIGNRIFPFGDRSFLHIDMYHQYFPFLTEFFHKLRSGDSLFYSWNTGIGSNFVALYAYYLASPLNWLCLLCPEQFLMEFISYFVVIKTGLCGLTFAIYAVNHFKKDSYAIALFSCFYAMSGYMAAYNWNVMWLDCIVLAPLIILGLEKLVEEGKYKLYCLSLAVAILSNYYICIMICIYLVLYFLLVLLPGACEKGKACLRFAIYSLISGGMAGIMLLPAMAAVRLSKFSSASFPTSIKSYFSILDVLARHCMDVTIETGLDHWPNIYCSVAVLFLFPLYISCKNISTKGKLGKIVLLAFMLISFSTNTLTFIWHGMNYPDSLPSRQSFLYILLLLTVCLEVFFHMKETSKAELSRVFFGVLIFLILCQKLVTDDAFTDTTFLLSAVFLVAYAILIHLYRDYESTPKILLFMTVLVIILESGLNMVLTSVPTVSRTNYLNNYDTYNTLWTRQSSTEPDQFYRYEKEQRVTNNDAMLQDYPSASLFSSTSNGLVNTFYNEFGLKNSKVFYSFEGATPFTSALLSAKYTFSSSRYEDDSLRHLVDQENDIYLYENTYSLPLGFMISPNAEDTVELIETEETAFSLIAGKQEDDPEDAYRNPIERQNHLATMLGATAPLFDEISCETDGYDGLISVPCDAYIYAYCDTKQITSLTATGYGEPKTFKKMKNKRIIDLGFQKGGSEVVLDPEEDETLNLTAYVLNEEVLSSLMEKLNTQTMQIDSFKSTHITGEINATQDGYLVLSIPYDPGFHVKIDGVETECELFEEMMITVPVSEGTHTISISYVPEGLLKGSLLTLFSISVFLLIIFYPKYKSHLPWKKTSA